MVESAQAATTPMGTRIPLRTISTVLSTDRTRCMTTGIYCRPAAATARCRERGRVGRAATVPVVAPTIPPMDLWRLSATELLDGYASGAFSCAEVVADVVAHVRVHNPSLNALVVDLGDEAAVAAREPTRRGRGDAPGPLHGVPATIKQNIDVSGQPTPNGLPALKDNVAPTTRP